MLYYIISDIFIILFYIVSLYCFILYYITFCFTLYCFILYYSMLYYITFCYTILYNIIFFIKLYYNIVYIIYKHICTYFIYIYILYIYHMNENMCIPHTHTHVYIYIYTQYILYPQIFPVISPCRWNWTCARTSCERLLHLRTRELLHWGQWLPTHRFHRYRHTIYILYTSMRV